MNDLSQWIDQLNSHAASDRARAAEQLARLGAQARAAAVPLVRSCGDVDESVLEWAAAALEEMGPPSADDCDALAELLDDQCSDVGYWAATLLGRLRQHAAPAVETLAAALSRKSIAPAVRQRIAWALGKIGPAASHAQVALQQAAQSSDTRLARLATQALAQIRG